MNYIYLVIFALVPSISILAVHYCAKRAIITSGLTLKYLALVSLEVCMIGVVCSTVCQFALKRYAYMPTELLSSIVGIVSCLVYLVIVHSKTIKQISELDSICKSRKYKYMLCLLVSVVAIAICIHSFLLSYVMIYPL